MLGTKTMTAIKISLIVLAIITCVVIYNNQL